MFHDRDTAVADDGMSADDVIDDGILADDGMSADDGIDDGISADDGILDFVVKNVNGLPESSVGWKFCKNWKMVKMAKMASLKCVTKTRKNELISELMNELINQLMNELINRLINQWMNGLMNQLMNGLLNEWCDGCEKSQKNPKIAEKIIGLNCGIYSLGL
jgi:hypothetical protein